MSKFSLPKDEAVETPVDIAALQAFAAGTKDRLIHVCPIDIPASRPRGERRFG
jgi:hypothetical protein